MFQLAETIRWEGLTNCSSALDHFVGLALKESKLCRKLFIKIYFVLTKLFFNRFSYPYLQDFYPSTFADLHEKLSFLVLGHNPTYVSTLALAAGGSYGAL